MTVSFVSSTLTDTSTAASLGTSGTAVAAYGTVTSGNLVILHANGRAENQTFGTPTNGTWTSLTSLSGGDIGLHGVANVGSNDNGGTMLGVWYKTLTGSETGNVSVSTSGGGGSNSQTNNILQYSQNQSGFATPIFVTGSDDTHAVSRSVTFGTWGSALQVGDVVVVINSIDTDNAATINTPTFSQTGTTFGTVSYRARGLNGTNSDSGFHVYEATVTAGGSTNALTFTWSTGSMQSCGPAVAIRLRDIPSSPPQTVNLSLITETDVNQSLTGAKSATTALISGTQTAQAITKQKTKAVALTTEAATAQTMTYSRQQTVNRISQANTALGITATFTSRVNLVTETDVVFTHGKRKTKTLSLVLSDNFIIGLSGQHSETLGLAEETDSVFAINEQKFTDIEIIVEDSTAQPITRQRGRNLNLVTEIDRAITLGTRYTLLQVVETDSVPVTSRLKRRSLALITETDAEFTIQPFHTDLVAQVTETDSSLPLHIIYTRLVHQVSETDTAFAVHQFLKRNLNLVSETDFANVLTHFTKQKLLTLVTGNDIARAIGPKLQHPPSSIILDVVIPDPTQLTVFIEDDEITSGLVVLVSQRF